MCEFKTCAKCKTEKAITDFSPSKQHKDGKFPWCKPCKAAYQAPYKALKDPEEIRKYDVERKAQRKAREDLRAQDFNHDYAYALKKRYGITPKDVADMMDIQMGVCAICGGSPGKGFRKSLHVDHDHVSGKVRGLLCEKCNQGLGSFQDDPNRMLRAIEYLGAPPSSQVEGLRDKTVPLNDRVRRSIKKHPDLDSLGNRLASGLVPDASLKQDGRSNPRPTIRTLPLEVREAIIADKGTMGLKEAAAKHGVSLSSVWSYWHDVYTKSTSNCTG